MLKLFPLTTKISNGHITIGGCDTTELAAGFGTPLYIFDETTLRSKCAEYREAFEKRYPDSVISYACKAYLNRALAQIFDQEGLSLDVVSGGELAIARAAGFPMERVHFNGNNKSRQDLDLAIECGIGRIIVDNFYEISLLDRIAGEADVQQEILLRISPGIDPHTHAHLTTGNVDSKFGFPMTQAEEAIAAAMSCSSLNPVGLHFHIGSQIFDLTPYIQAINAVMDFADVMRAKYNFNLQELSTGGGLGIAYSSESVPPTVGDFADTITVTVTERCASLGFELPKLIVEPGRSIIGQAGVALYTVGAIKDIEGVRKYVSVDGGMSDNIRPSLYDAKYEAMVANKAEKHPAVEFERITIAGKYCESGDILIKDIDLPKVEPGDLIAVPCCGAYCLSMASNYNAALKPAIVLVKDGNARLIRRRETYEDLTSCDTV
ncbi:MAG: diaminopimelate decarboxylase [Chloroflexota bacterium]|nr:diaminopimelate decarboxylase [Chloroflexota bacterium]